jgi:hypothetical protein
VRLPGNEQPAEEKYSCLVSMWIAGCSCSYTSIRGSIGFKPVHLAFLGTVHKDLVVEGLLNVVQSSTPHVVPSY